MASAAQVAANRRNALRSTGPKTSAGKARSRSNAYNHGFYARAETPSAEDAAKIGRLTQDYRQRLQPQDPIEENLVRRLALTQFRLSRIAVLEAALLNSGLAKAKRRQEHLQLAIGKAVRDCFGTLEKLSRYESSLARSLDLTLELLLTRQRRRRQESDETNPIASVSSRPQSPIEIRRLASTPLARRAPRCQARSPAPRDQGGRALATRFQNVTESGMARGQRGPLLLHCWALASPVPCRFIPALSGCLQTRG